MPTTVIKKMICWFKRIWKSQTGVGDNLHAACRRHHLAMERIRLKK
jgi:hypothetical protein